MLCPNCKSTQRDSAKFCDECGFPLTGAIARWAASADETQTLDVATDIQNVSVEEACQEGNLPETGVESFGIEAGEELSERAESDHGVYEDASSAAETAVLDGMPEEVSAETSPEEVPAESTVEEDAADEVLSASEDVEEEVSASAATAVIAADLSGFDRPSDVAERLVEPGYKEPHVEWRDGDTMKMPRVEGEEAPKSKEYLASSTTKQSKKPKIIAGVIVGLAVVAALVAFATYQMQLWGGISVPDVVGMTEADATSVLQEEGFGVRSLQVKSDDTEGLVLVMDPGAGTRIDEGSEVLIHISTARIVPDISGMTEEEATAALAEEGFGNVIFTQERSDAPEGTALSVDPMPGSRAKSAQTITVKLAEPFIVPDVTGMSLEEAQTAVSDAGLQSEVEYVNTMEFPDGQAMGTKPEAGSQVKSTTVVTVRMARARGIELEELTRGYLAPGNAITIGIYNYEVVSLDSVHYVGNDTVEYVMTARPFTYILGEAVSISARQIRGEISWTENNTVASIS